MAAPPIKDFLTIVDQGEPFGLIIEKWDLFVTLAGEFSRCRCVEHLSRTVVFLEPGRDTIRHRD